MPNFISEDQIEKAIIQVFEHNLGYRHSMCMERDITGRLNENEVVIKLLLRQQLIKLNPTLSLTEIEEAF